MFPPFRDKSIKEKGWTGVVERLICALSVATAWFLLVAVMALYTSARTDSCNGALYVLGVVWFVHFNNSSALFSTSAYLVIEVMDISSGDHVLRCCCRCVWCQYLENVVCFSFEKSILRLTCHPTILRERTKHLRVKECCLVYKTPLGRRTHSSCWGEGGG